MSIGYLAHIHLFFTILPRGIFVANYSFMDFFKK